MPSKKIPNIVVEPPGTKSLEWLRRDEAVLSPYNRPFYYPLVVEGGEGAIVRGLDGNEYIDFNSGIAVLNVGQCMHAQAACRADFGLYPHPIAEFLGLCDFRSLPSAYSCF